MSKQSIGTAMLAAVIVAAMFSFAPRFELSTVNAASTGGMDISALTKAAKMLPDQGYPTH
jgi:hypothetical protein